MNTCRFCKSAPAHGQTFTASGWLPICPACRTAKVVDANETDVDRWNRIATPRAQILRAAPCDCATCRARPA